mmetsp:Transcript_25681/g.82935  ORF Transcript_25681/g.82935 Transcript_25681/m.82935 type:complete len:560 (+) Transcript_25681:80-1759(+)
MEAETPAASTGGVDAIDLEGDCFSHKVLPISMEWSDISVTVRVGGMLKTKALKQILAPTSGSASPGDLLAIMGPSGSGKTTLLDALANRIASSKVEGTVTFNGSAFSASERHQHISYVSQDDSLLGVFTVTETLQQAARFCYGYSQSSAQLKAVIEEAIETVGLRSAAHTVVGDIFRKGLSGGQKRRLSLAVELVKKPSILIIDEPTSGLDSASAYGIMHNLTLLCKVGHTIVTTIHQPSSEIYQMFDQFMLLSRGKTLYSGPASGSVGHFSAMGYPCPEYNNPADFFLSLVNNDFPLHPCDLTAVESAYQSSAILKAALDKISSVRASPTPVLPSAAKLMGVGADFVTLCKRNLTNNMRNPGIYWVRFAMYTMLSLMIGFMYWDLGDARTASSITSRVSVLFFCRRLLSIHGGGRAALLHHGAAGLHPRAQQRLLRRGRLRCLQLRLLRPRRIPHRARLSRMRCSPVRPQRFRRVRGHSWRLAVHRRGRDVPHRLSRPALHHRYRARRRSLRLPHVVRGLLHCRARYPWMVHLGPLHGISHVRVPRLHEERVWAHRRL